jgi:hypothetical protein
LLSGECKHALSERCTPLRALHGPVDQPPSIGVLGQALAQNFQIAHDGHQQVVEVMRDSARQLPHAFHLLRLQQLLLSFKQFGGPFRHALLQCARQRRQRGSLAREFAEQPLTLQLRVLAGSDIRRHADQAIHPPMGIPERAGAQVDPMRRAVRANVAVFDDVVGAAAQGLLQALPQAITIVRLHGSLQIIEGELA